MSYFLYFYINTEIFLIHIIHTLGAVIGTIGLQKRKKRLAALK